MSVKKRGFASISAERRKEISSLGGKASTGNFKHDSKRAKEAGRKGGLVKKDGKSAPDYDFLYCTHPDVSIETVEVDYMRNGEHDTYKAPVAYCTDCDEEIEDYNYDDRWCE